MSIITVTPTFLSQEQESHTNTFMLKIVLDSHVLYSLFVKSPFLVQSFLVKKKKWVGKLRVVTLVSFRDSSIYHLLSFFFHSGLPTNLSLSVRIVNTCRIHLIQESRAIYLVTNVKNLSGKEEAISNDQEECLREK